MSEPEAALRVITHHAPSGGVPPISADDGAIRSAVDALQAGTGPLALDAERASGYRYSQRAYLLQFARTGAPMVLLDPVAPADHTPLLAFANAVEWVLHAATQDLPCLRELGFRPSSVHDTELAAKVLGRPRVGLGALLEAELDVVLAKEHSAVDWSARPLPEEWLAYAALDVEFLVPLLERLLAELDATGRRDWYEQERALLLDFTGPEPRPEPWRRVSGLHAIRDPRRLAVVRALWEARDQRARTQDVSPGRVLHDSVIIDIAQRLPANVRALESLRPVHSRNARKDPAYWWAAIEHALGLPEGELPRRSAGEATIPPPRSWAQRNPEGAQRWERVRPAVVTTAEALGVSAEVLVSPEVIRTLCWSGLAMDDSSERVAELLQAQGARPWQAQCLAEPLAQALASDID